MSGGGCEMRLGCCGEGGVGRSGCLGQCLERWGSVISV